MSQLRKVLEAAGLEWHQSEDAARAMEQIERDRQIRLPAVFRELWTTQGVVEWLHGRTNCDWPVPAEKLAAWNKWDKYDAIGAGFLPFMNENQSVATWAISLRDGDDPPVYVEVDSGSPPHWVLLANSLTDWIECVTWDHDVMKDARWQAQAPELTAQHVQQLGHRFKSGTTTFGWPGCENRRFEGELGRILVWSHPPYADWYVAPVKGHEEEMIDELRHLRGLERSLYRSWNGD